MNVATAPYYPINVTIGCEIVVGERSVTARENIAIMDYSHLLRLIDEWSKQEASS